LNYFRDFYPVSWRKWKKLNNSRFECQSIANLSTSPTRYDILHLDLYFYYGIQKPVYLGLKNGIPFKVSLIHSFMIVRFLEIYKNSPCFSALFNCWKKTIYCIFSFGAFVGWRF